MPNPTETEFRRTAGGITQNDRLYGYFLDHPSEAIPMVEIGAFLACYAVHSRVADVRRRFEREGLGTITNQQRVDKATGQRWSWYTFKPA